MYITHATYDNVSDLLSNAFEEYMLSTGNAFFPLHFSVQIPENKLKNKKGLGLQESVECEEWQQ